jgi:peptidyl-prolyl cis-trans isomerase B (cyclophilin B)
MLFKLTILTMIAIATLLGPSFAFGQEAGKNPQVVLRTSAGDITLELYPDKAPISVENFIGYVKDKHYNNTIFHRVIDGFMVQGGGMTSDFKEKQTLSPINIEADNGLKNTRGSVAMARTSDPNSATAQFFINVVDNSFLDFKNPTPSGWGYTVFGKVIQGMDVVDKIAKVKTGNYGMHRDVPLEPIVIFNAQVVGEKSDTKSETKAKETK